MKPVARETDRSPVKRVLFHPQADYALNALCVVFFASALSSPAGVAAVLMHLRNSLTACNGAVRHVGALLY